MCLKNLILMDKEMSAMAMTAATAASTACGDMSTMSLGDIEYMADIEGIDLTAP